MQPKIFNAHRQGKISTKVNYEVNSDQDLAVVYTPGVAEVCKAIGEDKERANDFTIKGNTVAVLSDGSAILGLGDLGPEAALPVMEGKAMLFKSLAGVNAFPVCVNGKTVDEIVNICKALEPTFGGFNLEDISAPRCFEIEERLQEELSVPVIHDDQHGTAVVVLAGLLNSLKIVNKKIEDLKIVVSGAGAAGVASTRLLILGGAKPENVIVCDRRGAIFEGRENLNNVKEKLALETNSKKIDGGLKDVLKNSDLFIGLSGPKLLTKEDLETMNQDAIIFGLSNPIPEFDPENIPKNIAVVATGRSDYPNQINNVLVFPGFFKGLFKSRAKKVTTKMKIEAAKAIAGIVSENELNPKKILPKALDKRAVDAVADAI